MKDLNLTPYEQGMFDQAIGDGNDWPQWTTNPRVNYAIDCRTADLMDEPCPEYIERDYLLEIEIRKERGEIL